MSLNKLLIDVDRGINQQLRIGAEEIKVNDLNIVNPMPVLTINDLTVLNDLNVFNETKTQDLTVTNLIDSNDIQTNNITCDNGVLDNLNVNYAIIRNTINPAFNVGTVGQYPALSVQISKNYSYEDSNNIGIVFPNSVNPADNYIVLGKSGTYKLTAFAEIYSDVAVDNLVLLFQATGATTPPYPDEVVSKTNLGAGVVNKTFLNLSSVYQVGPLAPLQDVEIRLAAGYIHNVAVNPVFTVIKWSMSAELISAPSF